MNNMFQKTPTMKSKQPSQGKKLQKLLTEIGGGWCKEKLLSN